MGVSVSISNLNGNTVKEGKHNFVQATKRGMNVRPYKMGHNQLKKIHV